MDTPHVFGRHHPNRLEKGRRLQGRISDLQLMHMHEHGPTLRTISGQYPDKSRTKAGQKLS